MMDRLDDATPIPIRDESVEQGADGKIGAEDALIEAAYLEQLQRLQAEFINYKRRVEKEMAETAAVARGDVILRFLPVFDDLDRLLDHHSEDKQVAMEAVRLIHQKFDKLLRDEGVEWIGATGKAFDPTCHEAVEVAPVPEDRDGVVLDEWERGCRYRGRLLRPSRVKVGKAMTLDSTK